MLNWLYKILCCGFHWPQCPICHKWFPKSDYGYYYPVDWKHNKFTCKTEGCVIKGIALEKTYKANAVKIYWQGFVRVSLGAIRKDNGKRRPDWLRPTFVPFHAKIYKKFHSKRRWFVIYHWLELPV